MCESMHGFGAAERSQRRSPPRLTRRVPCAEPTCQRRSRSTGGVTLGGYGHLGGHGALDGRPPTTSRVLHLGRRAFARATLPAVRPVFKRGRLDGTMPIYFYHVRKSAGTSLIKSFLALSASDPDSALNQLAESVYKRRRFGDHVYVGWNLRLLSHGGYFFGFSHASYDEINIPRDWFRITCLRDPVERVISHYRMLVDLRNNHPNHPALRREAKLMGQGIDDFIDRAPRSLLANQLYTFSNRFDLNQAAERALSLDAVLWADALEDGVASLSSQLELTGLQSRHSRKSLSRVTVPHATRNRLSEMLADETELLSIVKGELWP